LSALGAEVTDVEVVRNVPADVTRVPAFDAVFFASSSAVTALMDRGLLRAEDLAGKPVVAIGKPTAEALAQRGVGEVWLAPEATVASALWMLAGRRVFEAIRDMDAAR
jgi:uroporphyrinogen-III synthase